MTAPPYILKIRRNRPETRIVRVAVYLIVLSILCAVFIQQVTP